MKKKKNNGMRSSKLYSHWTFLTSLIYEGYSGLRTFHLFMKRKEPIVSILVGHKLKTW